MNKTSTVNIPLLRNQLDVYRVEHTFISHAAPSTTLLLVLHNVMLPAKFVAVDFYSICKNIGFTFKRVYMFHLCILGGVAVDRYNTTGGGNITESWSKSINHQFGERHDMEHLTVARLSL